ncbi:MAG: hypothetical protein M9894_04275 [Planctomycetes bacterium]|nr:hypothetical protein [Planctomycetota bacterium]
MSPRGVLPALVAALAVAAPGCFTIATHAALTQGEPTAQALDLVACRVPLDGLDGLALVTVEGRGPEGEPARTAWVLPPGAGGGDLAPRREGVAPVGTWRPCLVLLDFDDPRELRPGTAHAWLAAAPDGPLEAASPSPEVVAGAAVVVFHWARVGREHEQTATLLLPPPGGRPRLAAPARDDVFGTAEDRRLDLALRRAPRPTTGGDVLRALALPLALPVAVVLDLVTAPVQGLLLLRLL